MPLAVNYGTGISSAWSNVAAFVPKFVVFLIILIVGWLIAKVITKAISAVLTRVGFDRVVERGGVKKALEHSKYDASDVLAKIVYYALMLFVLSTAFGVFGANPVSTYLHAVIAYLPLVFVAIVIVIISSAIAAAAKALIENSLSGVSYAKVLGNVVSGLILAFGVIASLDQLHVATNVVNAVLYAALAALVGVVVVAVGGGGIKTMSRRWEAVASAYDREKPRIAESVRNAPPVAEQARQAKDTVSQYASTAGGNGSSSRGATRY
jgi:Flp pilus assembly pilin Flp